MIALYSPSNCRDLGTLQNNKNKNNGERNTSSSKEANSLYRLSKVLVVKLKVSNLSIITPPLYRKTVSVNFYGCLRRTVRVVSLPFTFVFSSWLTRRFVQNMSDVGQLVFLVLSDFFSAMHVTVLEILAVKLMSTISWLHMGRMAKPTNIGCFVRPVWTEGKRSKRDETGHLLTTVDASHLCCPSAWKGKNTEGLKRFKTKPETKPKASWSS